VESAQELFKSINDPEVLRRMGLHLLDEIAALNNALKKSRAQNDAKELAKQEWLDQSIKLSMHKLQRVAFGFGREVNKLRDRERIKTEKQLTLQSTSLVAEIDEVKNDHLPIEEKLHYQSEEDLLEHCHLSGLVFSDGDKLEIEQIPNLFEESFEITVTRETYRRIKHKRVKYKAKNLTTGAEKILTAPGPTKLYPKCQFSVDFAVYAVTQKFLKALPYERQRCDMRRAGLNIPVITLCRLESGITSYLESVAEKIREDILSTSHLAVGLDETTWPILNGKIATDGYFWILCNQAGSYYRYEPTRSGQIAMELLKGYSGSVISDKFSGYLQLSQNEDINWGLCLAHARREFISLQDHYPTECGKVIDIMDKVFALEHESRSWSELKTLRQETSSELMSQLKLELENIRKTFFPREEMSKAAEYVLSNWKEFTAFLKDTTLPVSNNESERALRQAVLGRKNYRGSKTIDAADRAAVLFTIVESCKKAEIDSEDYIKYVISEVQSNREAKTPLKLALELRGPNTKLMLPTMESKNEIRTV
jgi:transposase